MTKKKLSAELKAIRKLTRHLDKAIKSEDYTFAVSLNNNILALTKFVKKKIQKKYNKYFSQI